MRMFDSGKSLCALATMLFCFCGSANAGLVVPPGNSPLLIPESHGATISYDASLDLFGAVTSATFDLDSGSPTPSVADIAATFTMAANIDNAGHVLNGSFSLTGESPSLGITTPTTLASGTVTGVGGANSILQFFVDSLSINSAIEGITGGFDHALINFYAFPPGFNSAGLPDFTKSYHNTTADDAPGIFFVASIPEPDTLATFVVSILFLTMVAVRRKRKRVMQPVTALR
jgi:hypothetical protein